MADSSAKHSFTVDSSHIIPHGKLLEGTTYDERTDTLYYIDIPAGSIFVSPTAANKPLGVPKSYVVSSSVGVIGLTSDPNKLICGVEDGISILDLATGTVESIKTFPNGNVVDGWQLRSNDGSVAPDGSFWVGTMDDTEKVSLGSMWFLKNKDSQLKELWSGAGIPNGINWDTARNVVYWTDSIEGTIYKYDFDPKTFEIKLDSKAPWFFGRGIPDGSCIDKDGNLYVALWGGNKIVRVTPDCVIDMEWKFPSKNITCCAFGDKDFKTLYVTSADLGDDDEPDVNDNGAAVYRIDVSDLNIQGMPKSKFIL